MDNSGHDADAIVIGAGPAGLAAARMLGMAGRRVEVLELEAAVAPAWRRHRAGLRLHTTRRHSGLPGSDIPAAHGEHPRSSDLVGYYEDYAREHSLDITFGVKVSRIERMSRHDKRWLVTTDQGRSHAARTVVVATGHNREPHIPDLPGRATYERPLQHVTEYRGGTQYVGHDVLVIGAGNAAAEASAELIRGGASRVRMAIRTTPHIRRDVCGVPAQDIAIMLSHLPLRCADRAAALLALATIPPMNRMGLRRPKADLFTRATHDRSVPIHDAGIVRLVRSGAVEPVSPVVALEGAGVRLSDGSLIHPDVVVAATGYRRGLETLLEGLAILDDRGNPPPHDAGHEGLHFVGFRASGSGALRDISADAVHLARQEGPGSSSPASLNWLSSPPRRGLPTGRTTRIRRC